VSTLIGGMLEDLQKVLIDLNLQNVIFNSNLTNWTEWKILITK